MLARETSTHWSLKRRSDEVDEEFGEFEEDKEGNTRDGRIAGFPKPPAPHFRGDAFRAAVFRNRTAPSA